MEDIRYFLRENRPSLLIWAGAIISFVWLLIMISYNLFTIEPFGEGGLSMGWALSIFLPLAPILLFATYWGGSENSPVDGTARDVARFVYVSFKNCMVVLALFIMLIGFPRMKYYQMRTSDEFGLRQLSYYQQRTLFNMFREGSEIIDSTSSYNEDPNSEFVPVPVDGADVDSDSSSSSSSDSDDGWGKIFGALLIYLIVFLVVIYYFGLGILCFFYVDFWLVALICIAIGMICLGIIDIMDGPRI
ncbi:TPA: hypothetical protein DIU27_03370 [Candidatus Collierbacteria bacterium]|uniref:Uncharacterized protein n=1 Tax=Candidatus Collierbacteria bacterium GW2011_GWB2_44_22 TaxID=1618387 RepID=A0A0G1HZ66_9BACT|nr:MAG: hypothetical protein UW31_C0001G0004 [Candidatus Collierbacteria bacterium GW2011_GWA2_44_13]KKT52230.1 MAG: hypothetical protein UW44_C0003G0073 [Candidatus Collierbacteria bacterium GW2011_GWB2_44_22]KKT62406.1 MAG: hypothetical protein UW56_C0007G0014 [Candidatus Collierbacteria bacterium GW2011_GWD1_44_27]KKT66828.1 MAG: hypothetical protein UW58_C0002G0013 [Candidatus Collierbacteria bacterium GW2011_GWC2_44_30]KKT69092.1 MAG: hypothetical protein UW64_C0004G0014 [Microgenomates gr